jgi:hypothetical protein
MSPSDSGAQLYPQALGSLFVTFYDSQGYDGGILSRLHTGKIKEKSIGQTEKYIKTQGY